MLLNAIADALLPPASLAVLALVLVMAGRRWRGVTGVVLALLVALSLPGVSALLLTSLAPAANTAPDGESPQAIVILSADGIRGDGYQLEPGLLTLDRMRAGAALARRTGLPIIVTGGAIYPGREALATMMARSLQDDFGIAPRWVEPLSMDTWQNALFSAAILHAAGIQRVYLVTHYWHMRRAEIAFRRAGLQVTPASVRLPTVHIRWPDFIPRTVAWQESYFALHEWVGLALYTLRP